MATKTGTDIMTAMVEAARKRRIRALELRDSGMTVQQVGDKLGVSKQKASELIKRARQETAQGAA